MQNSGADLSPFHHFSVHVLSSVKVLTGKRYKSVDDIRNDAFALFEEAKFTTGNAIVTFRNKDNKDQILDTVPERLNKGQTRDLFIKFVCRSASSFQVDLNFILGSSIL